MLREDNKVQYISKQTTISAENLNNIQESVLDNAKKLIALIQETLL